uniref:Uncharacterized protein n=1 Tax=Stomoxys calcitrans TaxID=35570 RepID=A0A1I8PW85_STOCA
MKMSQPFENCTTSEPETGKQTKRHHRSTTSAVPESSENNSQPTLSIINLEFPHKPIKDIKGLAYNVQSPSTTILQRMESQTYVIPKERGYDFSETTNSDFHQNLVEIPKQIGKNPKKAQSPQNKRPSISSAATTPKEETASQHQLETSQKLLDSHHQLTEKPQKFKGPEWRRPCSESFVPGIPRKFIGSCPPNIEQIAKMSKTRQKFYLTQDPRKHQCLVNPEVLRTKKFTKEKEFQALSSMVKYAQNTCDEANGFESPSEESFICEVIDLENPLQLDFQGLDYKNTYQRDEQDLQNQRNYRQVARYMERRRVKAETESKVEEELHRERIRIPKEFDVRNGNTPRISTPPPKPTKLGQLFRSADKEINRLLINSEKERRHERYKTLYLNRKERRDQQKVIEKREQQERQENLGMITAQENFDRISKKINKIVEGNLKRQSKKELPDKSKNETVKPIENKKENVPKNKNLFQVGSRGSKFQLQGQIESYEQNLKNSHQCMTRDQWLKELLAKREKIKLDVELGFKKPLGPDDPKLRLFAPFGINYRPSEQQKSAIREYCEKPLGGQYQRVLRKNLRFLRPRLRYKVKKFNLVCYRFGSTAKRLSRFQGFENRPLELKNTVDYMEKKQQLERQQKQETKLRRLNLLGLPCGSRVKSKVLTKCQNSSSSSDAEWVPVNLGKEFAPIVPLRRRTNMPAPKFREPTLRQHPHRPRDYEAERVSSEELDEVVQTSAIPYLYKIKPDLVTPANVGSMPYGNYAEMLEARHHHDHWNPMQQQAVEVHYQPRRVKPEVTGMPKEQKERKQQESSFQTANPLGNKFFNENLSLPQWHMEEVLADFKSALKKVDTKETFVVEQLANPQNSEKINGDFQYPGREEYLKFLNEIKLALKASKSSEAPGENLNVNKASLLHHVDEDLQSIETCLSSLSSSQCTNLTNDSGSFLLLEDKEKIPLDYLRKSLVPFEELHRSRFRAVPIDVDKEEQQPYRVLPFSGQMKAQRQLTAPKDKFFTFSSRLRDGLRQRLAVPVVKMAHIKIGLRKRKFKPLVATDLDENYVGLLKCRTPIKMFNYKTCRTLIKDALRLKFESMVIERQLRLTHNYDGLNEGFWLKMLQLKELFEKLFEDWQKQEYEASMTVMYRVKDYYQQTDSLKKQLMEMEKQQEILNLDIVFLEAHWIRCIMMQNFHYLMADMEWRLKNDWIHRLTPETHENPQMNDSSSDTNDFSFWPLENLEDSIAKRSLANIRQREQDNAWAIKDFYELSYLPNKHDNLIVFPNAQSFFLGLENLKTKTFILLLELHVTLSLHTELQGQMESLIEWCAKDLQEKQDYVAQKCSKLYFMQDRAEWLRKRSLAYLDEPIEESFHEKDFLKYRGLVAAVWHRIVSPNMTELNENLPAVDMVAMMSDVVVNLLAKFESFPMQEILAVEQKLRKRRNYLRKQSHHAYFIEKRIGQEMQKVVRNLESPPTLTAKMSKRPTKLPRLYLKKRRQTPVTKEKEISEGAKFFFQAFNEDGTDIRGKAKEIRDSIAEVTTTQEQIIPFYFDHFLKLHGYTPQYNFNTQIEMRDGPELNRLKVRSVIPEVQERLRQWENMKKKIMEDHIAQNPNMYVNVV